jgi:hypothetical protein
MLEPLSFDCKSTICMLACFAEMSAQKESFIMSLLNKILSGTNGFGDAALRRGVPVAAIATLIKNRPDLAPLLDGLLVATMMGLSSEQDQLADRQGMTDWQVHKLEQNQELLFQLIEQLADAVASPPLAAGVAGSAAQVDGVPASSAAQVKERIRTRPQEMRVQPPAPPEKHWLLKILNGWTAQLQAMNRVMDGK